ncbi:MAG TPA: hypothetical protein VGS11_08800 [Candidatus Bathyarchaeia archaeon]|nr:hypothetical protein [Candidatus Bathyarchaeia archaeon]
MKRTSLTLAILALLLLAMVPASAAPSLQKGNQAIYNLSASISFLQSCGVGTSSSSSLIVCPMIATLPSTIDVNGTLGWTATDLNSTTASMNLTRDLMISYGDLSTSVTRSSGSFIESVNLATRIVTLLPIIVPEIDQALQMAQTNMATILPTGVSWSSSMSILDNTMMNRPLYTMWWVNGPLKLNQTIPVFVLPTNVTRASSVDLGGTLGTRTAWTLAYSLSRPLIPPEPATTSTSSIPIRDNSEVAFTFNYDQASDLLLTANADIHIGFGVETTIQPTPCSTPISPSACLPASSPTMLMREFGIDIQAALKLASTTVSLTHSMSQTSPSQTSGSQSTSGSGSGAGSRTSSGSNSGTNAGSGSSSGSSETNGGAGPRNSNPGQPRSPLLSAGWLPWVYGVLGIVAIALIGAGVWIARRRMKGIAAKAPPIQPSV